MIRYPAGIDSTTELPTVVDNVTPISGVLVNNLRDAIIAIEAELGVKPSGIYATVRSRLTAIELALANLPVGGGGGGGGTAVGTANTVQTTDGSGTFQGATGVKAGTGYIGFGTTSGTSGNIRFSDDLSGTTTFMTLSNGTDTYSILDGAATTLNVGTQSLYGVYKGYIASLISFAGSGLFIDTVGNTNIQNALAIGTTPATDGLIRLPYNGGSAAYTAIGAKNSLGDAAFLKYGPGDAWTLGSIADYNLTIFGGELVMEGAVTELVSVSAPLALFGNGGFSFYDYATGTPTASTGTIQLPASYLVNARSFDNTADKTVMSQSAGVGADYLFLGFNGTGGGFATPMNSIVIGAVDSLYLSTGVGGNTQIKISSDVIDISANTTNQIGSANGKVTDVLRRVDTTDATVTDIYTWVINNNTTYTVDVLVTAISDDATLGGSWKRSYTFRATGGVVTGIGTVIDNATEEESAPWDVTIETDGVSNGYIRVSGDAINIRWLCSGRIQSIQAP